MIEDSWNSSGKSKENFHGQIRDRNEGKNNQWIWHLSNGLISIAPWFPQKIKWEKMEVKSSSVYCNL